MPLNIHGDYNPLFFHNKEIDELPVPIIGMLAEVRRRYV